MLKRQLPLIIAFVMGTIFIVQFFVPHQTSQDLLTWVSKWIRIIAGISILLGIYSLLHFHYTHIARSSAGWGFSVVIFIAFATSIVAGFAPSILNKISPLPKPLAKVEQPPETGFPSSLQVLYPNGGEILVSGEKTNIQWARKGVVPVIKIEVSGDGLGGPWEVLTDTIDASLGSYTWTVTAPVSPTCYAKITSLQDANVFDVSDGPFKIVEKLPWYRITGVTEGSSLMWVFNNGILPFGATMFSLIGFFIASAAFRAFRARSLEATLLLLAGVIIMLGQTPIGQVIWQGIPDTMVWILTIPNMTAKRAIFFGIAMGSVAFSLRIIFGIERAYLGGGKE